MSQFAEQIAAGLAGGFHQNLEGFGGIMVNMDSGAEGTAVFLQGILSKSWPFWVNTTKTIYSLIRTNGQIVEVVGNKKARYIK